MKMTNKSEIGFPFWGTCLFMLVHQHAWPEFTATRMPHLSHRGYSNCSSGSRQKQIRGKKTAKPVKQFHIPSVFTILPFHSETIDSVCFFQIIVSCSRKNRRNMLGVSKKCIIFAVREFTGREKASEEMA